tara:strand:- start:3765 stop:4112 length:348 start_codon:yes stop_codon:yes gene_type:complete
LGPRGLGAQADGHLPTPLADEIGRRCLRDQRPDVRSSEAVAMTNETGNKGRVNAKPESMWPRNEIPAAIRDVKEIRRLSAGGALIYDIAIRMPHRSKQFIRNALTGIGVGASVPF